VSVSRTSWSSSVDDQTGSDQFYEDTEVSPSFSTSRQQQQQDEHLGTGARGFPRPGDSSSSRGDRSGGVFCYPEDNNRDEDLHQTIWTQDQHLPRSRTRHTSNSLSDDDLPGSAHQQDLFSPKQEANKTTPKVEVEHGSTSMISGRRDHNDDDHQDGVNFNAEKHFTDPASNAKTPQRSSS
ncbi:unnamed protein product, partial [Amoebophrya sp. A120]